ncbi:hypothetical protein ACFLQ5_02480 [Bacteroidota bacterium]
MTFKRLYILSAVIIFLLSSCKKDIKTPSWELDVLVPIIETSLDLDDIFGDTMTMVNSDNFVSLVFREEIYTFELDSIINFNDTLTDKVFEIPFSAYINPGQTFVDLTEDYKLNLDPTEISTVLIDSGFIDLKLINQLTEDLVCTYTIPNATKNGSSLIIVENVPAATTLTPYTHITKVDISGYNIKLSGSNSSTNTITYNIKMRTNPNGDTIFVTPQDSIIFQTQLNDVSIAYIKGYFGSEEFNGLPSTTRIDAFDEIDAGNFKLNNIKASLEIKNGYGIDAQLKIAYFNSMSSLNQRPIYLESPLIGSTVNINRASETFIPSNPVTPNLYIFQLDTTNLIKMIESQPHHVGYSMDVKFNPLGNISAGNDFVYKDYNLSAYFNLEIPLNMTIEGLQFTETANLNIDQLDNVKDGHFNLIATNYFPFSLNIQFYLLNENQMIVDSLLGVNHILSAIIDAQGNISNPQRTHFKIPIDETKMNKLKLTKEIFIKANVNSGGIGQHIKLKTDYKIDLKLTGDFNYYKE